MKLIKMTDFVLKTVQTPNINEAICWEQTEDRLFKIYQYSLFLKQPLTLGMFVPCDENGNFLKEPDHSMYFTATTIGEDKYNNDIYEYEQAKERVLFENARLVTFEEHKIDTLNGTTFLQIDNYVLSDRKDWKEEFDFYFNSIEEILHDESYEEIEMKLTEAAIKKLGLSV